MGILGEPTASLFDRQLAKPVKPGQLKQALERALQGQNGHVSLKKEEASLFDSELAQRLPLRILLTEDNAINQKVALRLLKRLGYRADVAGNGIEAIEALQRQAYDVILMDVQMPDMDGVEATQIIRHDFRPEQQPHIIALTANALEGDKERFLSIGMDDYISKPVRVHELVEALKRSRPQPSHRLRSQITFDKEMPPQDLSVYQNPE